ncbi:hypothetical protein Kpol_1018p11 [Vanderwaltozyma polyspora DSM 70294]|uniref:SPX domain-containing protein n=1 Tax=Vanderwaltozyma polyspora (strain ATCC 22028 / DSM 70294 / BCRC 21397 / CBS 2163 / NBRC 10782 / NRRL Y-8283 / UCD 57-17) TaxID=436907 RepID=A7TDL3_VANPO|nr:uncharacterized protein Kpol_1018p11 [Vanderwaltozyma polyspora DSM 70294]EDO19483.1 hypothetical protein Kpol_1018p11 [Vanderwaltozyma polyspora DSM 70294]
MKFSHSLQFNAVPEWSSKYIAYSHLKKLIYALQKEKLYNNSIQDDSINVQDNLPTSSSINRQLSLDTENSPLLAARSPIDNNVLLQNNNDIYINKFINELNLQLSKIDKFYSLQETNLIENLLNLKIDIKNFDNIYLSNLINPIINQPTSIHSSIHSNVENSSILLHRNKSLPTNRIPMDLNEQIVTSGNNIHGNDEDDDNESNYGFDPLVNTLSTPNFDNHGRKVSLPNSLNIIDNNIFIENKITLKKRLISIYTQFNELLDFINLNLTGFTKICKKFDKSLDTNIKIYYLNLITKNSHIFQNNTIENIKKIIVEIIIIFAKFTNSIPQQNSLISSDLDDNNTISPIINDYDRDIEELEENELFSTAKIQLSSHLRDHIIWERNTVWKDMINLERRANNVNNNNNINYFDSLYSTFKINNSNKQSGKYSTDKEKNNKESTDLFNIIDLISLKRGMINFSIVTAIFLTLLKFSPFDDTLQKNCFAILIYASILWATEIIPLFVTALMIPLLIVILPVLSDPKDPTIILTPVESSQYILSTMWSSVIMLLLGGFTLAAALSKYNIAKIISTKILSSVGTSPKMILFTNMCLALFISMWISNVAAPVICFSIIQPILRTLPKHSMFGKSLILGIALASNIGGMTSPISSPQNIFAISLMEPQPSWTEWFIISIPVCIISTILIWALLIITFPPDRNLKILQVHPIKEKFTFTQWLVISFSILTILLWCFSNKISNIFGELGIISIIPLVLFFGTGLLNSEDFNNFMWTIVVLAMGGTTLGKAVSSSGLLGTVANYVKEKVEHDSLFEITLIFGILILIIATFVSHVVAAMIVLPLMDEIGKNLGSNHSRLLIMIAAFLCSCAMGLPTSGIPNVTAISMTDELGNRYLTVSNFITRGVPASFLGYFVIITVGFGLMKLTGF